MTSGRAAARPIGPLLKRTLDACRGGFAAVVLFSFAVNLLLLTIPIYMLQLFDRVLTSRSADTLTMLSIAAAGAILTLAALEAVRSQVMVRISSWLDNQLSGEILGGSVVDGLVRGGAASVQGLRDLLTFRTFITGAAVFPFLDAPWTPIFIAVIFLFHPLLGWLSVAGATLLFALALLNELATRKLLMMSGGASIKSLRFAESAVRNADVIEAMGMMPNVVRRWHRENAWMLDLQARASGRSGGITAVSRFFRLCLQIAMLGVGAWLVIHDEITAGAMIAGSILLGRALAPVEQAIGSWKSAVAARGARRLPSRQRAARRDAAARGVHAVADAGRPADRRGVSLCLSRRQRAGAARYRLCARAGRGAGTHRPDRGGQDDPGSPCRG